MIGSITDVLRTAFIWLDDKIYGFIDILYNLFTMLGEATIFTADQIESFASKLYVLISIIMFFRLSFAFVTYIVNPDSLSDKQKGGGALIKKIVITMALLVSVPTIFNEAFYVQNLILKNDIINKVLLGDSTTQTETANRSKSLSTYAFLTFFTPTQKIAECQNYQGVAISDSCVSAINNADNASSNNSNANPGTAYKSALQNYDLKLIAEAELVNRKGLNVSVGSNNFFKTDDYYLFDYNFLISTAVGLGIAWILLGFCLDLAVRVVKLGFLEIIAPIPIILSLTPTQKNNTLGNWGRECLSTWASLFIRLMVISFALNLVVIVNTSGIFSTITGGTNQFSMVTIFVVIGILLFAKEFPKLLEDILGLKGAGKMTFNAFKKMGSVPLVGGAAMAATSFLGNTGKNLAAGIFPRGREHFKENMAFAGKEAFGRFKHAGFMGNDKPFGGDTQHKMVVKRNQEYKKQIGDAKKGFDEKVDRWQKGNDSIAKQKSLGAEASVADYKKAGFKNDNFIKAAMGIEQTKDALTKESSNLTRANEQVTALTNSLYSLDKNDKNYQAKYNSISEELKDATHDRDGYKESVEKIEKTLKVRQETFEKNIAPLSQKDYELYQARNVAKGENPKNYGESASIPRFTNTHYRPGQYAPQENVPYRGVGVNTEYSPTYDETINRANNSAFAQMSDSEFDDLVKRSNHDVVVDPKAKSSIDNGPSNPQTIKSRVVDQNKKNNN